MNTFPLNRDLLLQPIPGPNPTGGNLRDDESFDSPFIQLRSTRNDARQTERRLDFGDAVPVRPDEHWSSVIRQATSLLETESKDIE